MLSSFHCDRAPEARAGETLTPATCLLIPFSSCLRWLTGSGEDALQTAPLGTKQPLSSLDGAPEVAPGESTGGLAVCFVRAPHLAMVTALV